MNYPRHVH